MTEKEFSKLKRHELLELLLAQGQEQRELEERLAEKTERLWRSEESVERLKEKLNEKDAQIEHLKKRLDKKDEKLRRQKELLEHEQTVRGIHIEESGSIAEAALRLNGIFEAAQKAADQYLENIRNRSLDAESVQEVQIDE